MVILSVHSLPRQHYRSSKERNTKRFGTDTLSNKTGTNVNFIERCYFAESTRQFVVIVTRVPLKYSAQVINK